MQDRARRPSLEVRVRRASRAAMPTSLDAAGECLTPTSLPPAHVRGFLWVRPAKGGKWTRRYVMCCANFVLWFSEKEAERPSKPIGALCFEDLVVTPLDPPPAEKEVAEFASNAFVIAPREGEAKASANVFSSATGRRYHFCAETEAEEAAWRTALMVWRHATLADEREQLPLLREALQQSRDNHRTEADGLRQQLEEAQRELESHASAADLARQQYQQIEEELNASEAALTEARQALRRSEAEKTDAVKHARKHQLTSALHKASRDTMQQRLEEMADELGELRTASGRHSGLSGRDEADSGRLGEAPNSARTEAGGGRNLFGGGVPAKKTTIAFGDDSARNDSFPTAANGSGAGGGGGGGGGGGRKGSVFNGGSKERKGSVMIGARKGSVFGGSKEPAGGGGGGGGGERGPALEEDGDEARPLSDVDDEKAVALLAKCQECSSHFKGFSPTELVTLARTLAVLHFKEGETILCQGEPATFFAVVLEGALAPVVDGMTLTNKARGEGELVGELALFHGGTRQASLVASADGFLAAFQFAELERLRSSADDALSSVGKKLNLQLARAALIKTLEGEGRSFELLTSEEREERLMELRVQQAEQRWGDAACTGEKAAKESLFKRKLNSATKKVRKQSAHAMAIGAKAGAATARVAGATGRAAVGAAKVGFSLPTRALNDDAPAEEIDLSDEVLALEPPRAPGKNGVWREGPLRKRPPSKKLFAGGLQTRHCILKSDALYYYAEKKDDGGSAAKSEEARGKIPLIAMRSITLVRTPDGAQIELSVGTRVFAFVGADDTTAHGWRLALESAKGYRGAGASKRMRERATSRAQRGDLAAAVVMSSKLNTRASRASSYSASRASTADSAPPTSRASSAAPAAAEPDLLAGWLQKQDHHAWSSKFKSRYFVLRAATLDYYRDESREEHLQTIELRKVVEAYSALDRNLSKFEGELHVKVEGKEARTYKLLAETHEQMRKWVKAISKGRHEALKAGGGGGGLVGALAARGRALSEKRNSGAGGALPAFLQSRTQVADAAEEDEEEFDAGWTESVTTEAEVAAAILRRINARFRQAAQQAQATFAEAAAAAKEQGAEPPEPGTGEIAALLQAADDIVNEMLSSADDFRYSEPPRPKLFERCLREAHANMYSNLAHVFREIDSIKPMDALQLLAWLEEYRERLALADAPPLQPPLIDVQRGLIGAFAAQSRETWEQWAANLHAGQVAALERGEIDNCQPLHAAGPACTAGPIDLLSFLNAPFASLKGLQVPSLTNAVVAVCAEVVVGYAGLQREYVQSVGASSLKPADLKPPAGGSDSTLAAAAVCAVINDAEKTIEMLEKLGEHIDEGVEEDEEVEDEDDEDGEGGAALRAPALEPGDDRAREALQLAEAELGTVAPSGSHVLAALCVYKPCAGNQRAPLLPRELASLEPHASWLETLGMVVAPLRWLLSKLDAHKSDVGAVSRAALQLLVGHTLETLLAGKANLLCDERGAGAQASLSALERFCGELSLDERFRDRELSPVRSLLELCRCELAGFVDQFGELRHKHSEAGLVVAEALLSKRGVPKVEAKDLASQCAGAAESLSPTTRSATDAWAPAEVGPLAGQPFSLASARLSGGGGGWKALKGLIKKK